MDWPALPLDEWRDTRTTLHMWLQIVGKVKLALSPFQNQWWQVALHLTARGMTTGPIPYPDGVFDVHLDFIDHNLTIRTSGGGRKALSLVRRSVAAFYGEFMAALAALGIEVAISTLPVEVPNPVRCDQNVRDCSYDAEYIRRWWRILLRVEHVLDSFRSSFSGKSSPVHFFWGSFDLAHTRFSGRAAEPPAGAPRFLQLAENQENYTCGFWPGNATLLGAELGQPAFFAYVYPAPDGLEEVAYFNRDMGEFLLPYDDLRRATAPDQALLDFFQSTYAASATLAGWDRANLESPKELAQ